MKRSDSSDSDSAELMTAFRIFTRSLSALKTPLTISTPTLSLVKTSLFLPSWGWASLHIRQAWIYYMYLKRYRNIRSCKLVFSISENSSQLCRSGIKYLEAVCRLMIWLLNADALSSASCITRRKKIFESLWTYLAMFRLPSEFPSRSKTLLWLIMVL